MGECPMGECPSGRLRLNANKVLSLSLDSISILFVGGNFGVTDGY